MKNRFKSALSLLFALIMIFTGIPSTVIVLAENASDKDYVFEIRSSSVDGEDVRYAILTDYTGNADELIIPAETDGVPVTRITNCTTPTGVKSIVVPDSVISITDTAFPNCRFRSFVTGNGVTVLPYALIDAETLESAVIGNGIDSIYDVAFRNCKNLKNVTLGSVKNIGVSAFRSCASLEKIVLPSSVETIGEYAFLGCDKLRSVTVSGNINIAENAFSKCNIEEVKLIENASEIPCFVNADNTKSIVLGDGFKEVPDLAFRNYYQLESVELGKNIRRIGISAFRNCTSLKSITIPESVETISEYAFAGCSLLNKVIIPESVKKLEPYVFYNCVDLKSVRIPASVTSVDENAFRLCVNLKYVYFGGTEAEWNRIDLGKENPFILNAKVFCNIPQPAALQTIKMVSAPVKTTYHKNEKFDSTGLCVKAVYSNTEFEIADYEIAYDFSSAGTAAVTVSFTDGGKTAALTFEATVVEHFPKREVKAAGCEENGYIRDVCEFCGKIITETVLPAKGHVKVTDKKSPNCHEAGYERVICPNCGKIYSNKVLPQLSHEWTSWATIQEATYRATGIQRRQCRLCGDSQDKEIPMKKMTVTGIEVSMPEITMNYKQTTRLYANVIPEEAAFTADVQWKSSNTRVATVDENGTVTATGKGTAIITASTSNGKIQDKCTVNVTYSFIQEIIIYLLFGWIWY